MHGNADGVPSRRRLTKKTNLQQSQTCRPRLEWMVKPRILRHPRIPIEMYPPSQIETSQESQIEMIP